MRLNPCELKRDSAGITRMERPRRFEDSCGTTSDSNREISCLRLEPSAARRVRHPSRYGDVSGQIRLGERFWDLCAYRAFSREWRELNHCFVARTSQIEGKNSPHAALFPLWRDRGYRTTGTRSFPDSAEPTVLEPPVTLSATPAWGRAATLSMREPRRPVPQPRAALQPQLQRSPDRARGSYRAWNRHSAG